MTQNSWKILITKSNDEAIQYYIFFNSHKTGKISVIGKPTHMRTLTLPDVDRHARLTSLRLQTGLHLQAQCQCALSRHSTYRHWCIYRLLYLGKLTKQVISVY